MVRSNGACPSSCAQYMKAVGAQVALLRREIEAIKLNMLRSALPSPRGALPGRPRNSGGMNHLAPNMATRLQMLGAPAAPYSPGQGRSSTNASTWRKLNSRFTKLVGGARGRKRLEAYRKMRDAGVLKGTRRPRPSGRGGDNSNNNGGGGNFGIRTRARASML